MDRKPRSTSRALSETGQISNWLVKLVVFLGIAGLVIVEGGGVLVAKASVADTAEGAATEAALAIKARGVQGDPEELAKAFAESKGCKLVKIEYNNAAQTVTVTVRREARTFLIQHIGPLEKYTVATHKATRSYAGPG